MKAVHLMAFLGGVQDLQGYKLDEALLKTEIFQQRPSFS